MTMVRHDMAQVFALGGKQDALGRFASETGPTEAFKNKIEAVEHLLKGVFDAGLFLVLVAEKR